MFEKDRLFRFIIPSTAMPCSKGFEKRPMGTEGLALQQVANKVSALLWFRHDQTLDFLLCFPMWRTCPSYLKSQRAG